MSRADFFPSVYMRDWQNANRFRPNATPPRHNFNGFVEFIFNPDISTRLGESVAFRTQISSLVQNASLPSVDFNTIIKNQYNMKRIVQTGVEFKPVEIEVIDTVNNEWLLIFMRYFSYYYMNPRNRTSAGNGNERDQNPKGYASSSSVLSRSSAFMADTFDSNAAGFNLNELPSFIDQIKMVVYAGGKGVEYILFNPTLTSFNPGNINYTDSQFRKFSMSFEYENFTVNEKLNFKLNGVDKARFESYNTIFVNDLLDAFNKEKNGFNQREMEFLGTTDSPATRTFQTIPKPPPKDDGDAGTPSESDDTTAGESTITGDENNGEQT